MSMKVSMTKEPAGYPTFLLPMHWAPPLAQVPCNHKLAPSAPRLLPPMILFYCLAHSTITGPAILASAY